jgi:hypothetical protein
MVLELSFLPLEIENKIFLYTEHPVCEIYKKNKNNIKLKSGRWIHMYPETFWGYYELIFHSSDTCKFTEILVDEVKVIFETKFCYNKFEENFVHSTIKDCYEDPIFDANGELIDKRTHLRDLYAICFNRTPRKRITQQKMIKKLMSV